MSGKISKESADPEKAAQKTEKTSSRRRATILFIDGKESIFRSYVPFMSHSRFFYD
ncbi:hypothetical protein GCM10028773_41000 [Spirosoma koreense]